MEEGQRLFKFQVLKEVVYKLATGIGEKKKPPEIN